MKKILLWPAAVLLVAAFGCSKESGNSVNTQKTDGEFVPRVLTATISEVTKTSLSNGKDVIWSAGDEIGVFDEDGKLFKFAVSNPGGSSATFVQSEDTPDDLSGTTLYAIYPYHADDVISGGVITTSTSTSYSASPGSFARSWSNIMTAKTSDETLQFKNLAALLKLTIPEDLDLSQIYIASSAGIAGDVKVAVGEDGAPSVSEAPASNSGLIINPKDGESSLAAGAYYVPVLPGTYTGLRIKLTYASGEVTASDAFSLESFTASRNSVINIGEIYDGRAWYKWLRFENQQLPGQISVSDNGSISLSVTDNPKVGARNSSAYALCDAVTTGSSNSGYFTVDLSGINASVRSRITGFKFYFLQKESSSDFLYPRVRFNSQSANEASPASVNGTSPSASAWTQAEMNNAMIAGAWNVLEFRASQIGAENFSSITSVQIRPALYFSGSNKGTASTSCYIDDIGFTYE